MKQKRYIGRDIIKKICPKNCTDIIMHTKLIYKKLIIKNHPCLLNLNWQNWEKSWYTYHRTRCQETPIKASSTQTREELCITFLTKEWQGKHCNMRLLALWTRSNGNKNYGEGIIKNFWALSNFMLLEQCGNASQCYCEKKVKGISSQCEVK